MHAFRFYKNADAIRIDYDQLEYKVIGVIYLKSLQISLKKIHIFIQKLGMMHGQTIFINISIQGYTSKTNIFSLSLAEIQ